MYATLKSIWGNLPRRLRLALTGLTVLALGYMFGFLWFLSEIPKSNLAGPQPTADAIVVLTGGPERIDAAMDLLTSGRGARLLVSGVHPEVTKEELSDLLSPDKALFDCCVDMDWRAEDTIGNAAETASWVEANGFQSLLVVTSAYHLPRALRELSHTMPTVELRGHPVFHDEVHLDKWWRYSGTSRLLIAEYSKFLLTLVRLGGLEEV
ncbi:YdcF family protein [Parvibaculaceae bacterium PLY_AMNH_Bact1]|nr:YdcF family protein [Parvibaculaceae bacterium PLY_AMNH_Bact1]